MHNAQLISHVDTDFVSRAELQALPSPEGTQTFKPIPHIELADMLDTVLAQNQIRIERPPQGLRSAHSPGLFQIRELDGVLLSAAPGAIARLLQEIQGDSQSAIA